VLCGPAGSGKSTWAAKHFLPTQIVSSDQCRELISDDPADQTVSAQAFELMHSIIALRIELGRLTIADATSLERTHRRELIQISKKFHFNAVAIVFDVAAETCFRRNADRERKVPRQALLNQQVLLERTLRTINREGFDAVYILDEVSQSNVRIRIETLT